MRFIHTADWHLGRLFHSVHLTEDQRFTLQGLVQLAGQRKVDAVLIAGDIFDRAVPPTDAVDLLDDTVSALAMELGIPVVMIAGNHDSPARLEYFSGLARRAGVHVVGRVGAELRPVELTGADGADVRFWPLAYTDPETARYELGRDDIHSHEAVVRAQLEAIDRAAGGSVRNVLVGHAFVLGCRECESERPLTVGGTGAVPVSLFDGIDYVALGHLHEAQQSASDRVCYSGSLLKYSFSETAQQKSVTLVELASDGRVSLDKVQLPIRRDVRQVRGAFAELLARPVEAHLEQAYVEVVLTDADPVLSPADRLRQRFPHLLSLRREEAERTVLGPASGSTGIKTRGTAELFADFYEDVKGVALSEPQTIEMAAALDQLERAKREVAVA
jgi:exonuclease SbcD